MEFRKFHPYLFAGSLRFKTVLLSLGIGVLLLMASFGVGRAVGPVADLGSGEQNVTILGNLPNAYLSELAGSADFNGDGYDDLLVGAAGHSRNGSLAGAAFMILGGANLDPTIDLASRPANLSVYGAALNDALGHSVAGGDVNGDGFADLIIAADGAKDNRGAVYVILGDASRFSTPSELDLNLSSSGVALLIRGPSSDSRFGRSVASGDINHDGYDDIIIGAFTASPGSRIHAGAVYVILGSSGITSASTKTIELQKTPQAAALAIFGAGGRPKAATNGPDAVEPASPLFIDELQPQATEFGDRLGHWVAVGDVNGDGTEDIITGAYGANVGGSVDAGKTYVFYGSSSYSDAAPQTVDLSTNPEKAGVTLNGVEPGDQSGFTVAAGDLNKDGHADILIGAYLSQGAENAAASAGEVYVVYGGQSLPVESNLNSAGVTIYGAAAGDRLGRSLASGDVNGDGYQDLILGASRADPNGRNDAGMLYVVYGRNKLASPVLLSNPDQAHIRLLGAGTSAVTCDSDVLPGVDCSDEVGHSSASGDINGDGADDVIAGAIYANNSGTQDTGAAYVVFGSKATGASISPEEVTVSPGKSVSFTFTLSNKFGSWNVTDLASFSIANGAGGSWKGNEYTASQKAGRWRVVGTYQNLSAVAYVTIEHGAPVSLSLDPGTAKAWVGEWVFFKAWASDAAGNIWDASGECTFDISPGAGGSWMGNMYTAEAPGSWTVTCAYQGLTASATIHVVEHNPAVAIKIQPAGGKIWVFEQMVFTAMAVDAQGVTWDVSDKTYFTGPGNFNGNVLTATRLGTWPVKADYKGLNDTVNVTVGEHGEPVAIKIQPDGKLARVGEAVEYTAWALDRQGNQWNVTGETTFSTLSGQGGSWKGNVFTPSSTGTWTLAATYQNFTGQANLTALDKVYPAFMPAIRK